jgi:hypothetical protein
MEGFLRPDAKVLDESALVPVANLISPAPNQFTHEVTSDQPYYYKSMEQGSPPDGVFPKGTKVVLLLYDAGPSCRVADGQGRYVAMEYASLRKL